MTIKVKPTLSMAPQITNVINMSRTLDDCYFELDSFMRILHFRKHHWYVNGSDTIKMKVNDGTNDNAEDTDTTAVNDAGLVMFLPTALLFNQLFTTTTPNNLIVNTTYVNEISKIVSLDQSLLKLIFTFSSAPSVNGTKYTRGNLVLNVVSGDHDLDESVLTVTPDNDDNVCVTVSNGDYTETFNGEAFGFNTMVSGKCMPKVTTLNGSSSHIVLKLRWLKADASTYVDDWVVLQNIGETPTAGSMYLTIWQYDSYMSLLQIGQEGWEKTTIIKWHSITHGFFRVTKTIHNHAMNVNYDGWDRTQDYTNDSIGQTSSFSSVPLQAWLLRYENDIFLAYHAEARLSNNSALLDTYTHLHATLDNGIVETTVCRQRKREAPVYQSTGNTCSYSFAGVLLSRAGFNATSRLNTSGSWANETVDGGPWTRDTGNYWGIGVDHNDVAYPERYSSDYMVFINYSSNLSFDFEKCENYTNEEYLIEPDLPNTLYVDDYIHHTHISVADVEAEFGTPLETLMGTIGTPTTHAYTNGALSLDKVLGGNHYTTPLRYILAYDSGYHIVDLLGEPFKWSYRILTVDD